MVSALATLLVAFTARPVGAQDPGPINTERPSFSSSPLALATGYWQLEAGYDFDYTDDGDQRQHTLPASLLRYGLHPGLELQLHWSGYQKVRGGSDNRNGIQDGELGLKWQVNDSDAVLPIGLYAAVTLPVGDQEFTSDDYDPKLGVFWSHANSGLFGTLTAVRSSGKTTFTNGIGIGFSLGGNLASFVELESGWPEGSGPSHTVNAGLTWLHANHLQFDINAGAGLNDRATDVSIGTGLAVRW